MNDLEKFTILMSASDNQIIVRSSKYIYKAHSRWKLRVTVFCAGNSPVTGEVPAQMASNAENVSIWWCHHVQSQVACHSLDISVWIKYDQESLLSL